MNVFFALEGELVLEHHFHQAYQSVLHMDLDEAEVLVALVLQDFGKEGHVVLFLDVSLDAIDDRCGPFNDQRLQAILLVQVGIHELLKCLFTDSILGAFLVKFDLLCIHVLNRVLQLLEREYTILSSPDGSVSAGRHATGWTILS